MEGLLPHPLMSPLPWLARPDDLSALLQRISRGIILQSTTEEFPAKAILQSIAIQFEAKLQISYGILQNVRLSSQHVLFPS